MIDNVHVILQQDHLDACRRRPRAKQSPRYTCIQNQDTNHIRHSTMHLDLSRHLNPMKFATADTSEICLDFRNRFVNLASRSEPLLRHIDNRELSSLHMHHAHAHMRHMATEQILLKEGALGLQMKWMMPLRCSLQALDALESSILPRRSQY